LFLVIINTSTENPAPWGPLVRSSRVGWFLYAMLCSRQTTRVTDMVCDKLHLSRHVETDATCRTPGLRPKMSWYGHRPTWTYRKPGL